MFVDRGTFWVLPLTYFYLPKSARAYLFPQSVKNHYFCSGPISVDPICPQRIDPLIRPQRRGQPRVRRRTRRRQRRKEGLLYRTTTTTTNNNNDNKHDNINNTTINNDDDDDNGNTYNDKGGNSACYNTHHIPYVVQRMSYMLCHIHGI